MKMKTFQLIMVLFGVVVSLLFFTGCVSNYHAYSGPKQPLEQLAVLLKGENVAVNSIDDKTFFVSSPKFYLLPGEHSITAGYFEGMRHGRHITQSAFFRKGHVYEVEGWLISGGDKWRMQISHLGTIEEASFRISELEEKHPSFNKKSLLWPF